MKRDFLTELGLETEQVNKIMAEHGKTVNTLKDEADQAKNDVEEYKKQLTERDNQLNDLSEKAKGNEDLQKQIQDLQKANDDAKKDYEAKLASQKKDFAIESALRDQKARNPKIAKSALDLESIKFEEGKLVGLDDQLKGLKENEPYLFGEPDKLGGRNPHPSDPNNVKNTQADIQKQYDEAMKSGNMPLAVSLKNKLFNESGE